VVNASFREAAANTLTVPDTGAELDPDTEDSVGDPPVTLEEAHPASRSPTAEARAVIVKTVRRICGSRVRFSGEGWGSGRA
jgi:hypothetical protein